MEHIISFLISVKLARKQVHRNMTVFPLLSSDNVMPEYVTLEQALQQGMIRVTEIDRQGSVPDLQLVNLGKKAVLVIEGEELVGAKQNRIVNSSFLVSAETTVMIPVSCVEQGRWHYTTDKFESGKNIMHASLRSKHQEDIRFSLQDGRGYRSDQGRIWNDISEKSARLNVAAPTGAMADIFDNYEGTLAEYLAAFQLLEHQVGAVFAIDGRILGLEGFGFPDTFGRFFGKLVRSYALDALDSQKTESVPPVSPDSARRFIASASKSKGQDHPSIGLGNNTTFVSRTVSGIALTHEEQVYHLSIFKKEKGHNSSVGYQRFTRRWAFRTNRE